MRAHCPICNSETELELGLAPMTALQLRLMRVELYFQEVDTYEAGYSIPYQYIYSSISRPSIQFFTNMAERLNYITSAVCFIQPTSLIQQSP
jgi:hypothetical protein